MRRLLNAPDRFDRWAVRTVWRSSTRHPHFTKTTVILLISLLLSGCNPSTPRKNTLAFELDPVRSAKSEIWLETPVKGARIGLDEPFRCTGAFRVGPAHRPLTVPKLSILNGRLSFNTVRFQQKSQRPDGSIPIEVEVSSPKKAGRYTLQATLSLALIEEPAVVPPRQVVITSPPLDVTVRDQRQ
jgi:hypothetical protein